MLIVSVPPKTTDREVEMYSGMVCVLLYNIPKY